MQSALVLGNATSTVKHPSLDNLKLLVCQPMQADGKSPDGPPLIAVDHLGAGQGEMVMLTSDGGAVREIFGVENSPIRWSVLGLIDSLISTSAQNRG
jgi:ethanolamine utilization protein EutN